MLKTVPNVTGTIVADDDPMIRGVLRSKLEAIGQTVFVASNGNEAVELATRLQPALIILDLRMPLMNGLLACQSIRQLPGKADTPIVILTSMTLKKAEDAATRVGATAFLTKPFRTGPLMEVLSRFLPVNEAMRQMINRDAARAIDIARRTSTLAPGRARSETEQNDPLDRGKDILAVLRP